MEQGGFKRHQTKILVNYKIKNSIYFNKKEKNDFQLKRKITFRNLRYPIMTKILL